MLSEVERQFERHKHEIHAELSRRLVRLAYIHALRSPRNDGAIVADWNGRAEFRSAFLLAHKDALLICTAGHVLRDLREHSSGDRNLAHLEVQAGFHNSALVKLPLSLDLTDSVYAFNEASGIDFGAIRVPAQLVPQLQAAGCKAFSGQQIQPPTFDPNLFVSMGFPRATREVAVTEEPHRVEVSIVQKYPMLPLEAVRDSGRDDGKIPRFAGRPLSRVGQLDDEVVLYTSANGMSGGPILALRLEDGGFHSALLAIQTYETLDGSILGGCYVRNLLDCIDGSPPWKADDLRSAET